MTDAILPKGTLKRIHVNQHNIRANAFHQNTDLPVFSIKTSKGNIAANSVTILGPNVLQYLLDKPLSCGAKVWIKTKEAVVYELSEQQGLDI